MQHFTPHTSSVSGRRTWLMKPLALLSLSIMGLALTGCAQVVTLGYLIGGPPSIEPDFDKETNISLNEKGRKVLVLCYAPKAVKFDYDSIDRELASHVAHRLTNNKIKVMDPNIVTAWLDENKDWDKPEEIGAYFEVDFVILIEINEFGLMEQGSHTLYRGHSECMISVYKMEDGKGAEIYRKEHISKYPTLQAVSTSEQSMYDFKKYYMAFLSEAIGRHFYEHFAGDDIPHGTL